MSAADARSLNGSLERPWKDRDQSTGMSEEVVGAASGRGSGGASESPEARERVAGLDGVVVEVAAAAVVCAA